jgi:integrase
MAKRAKGLAAKFVETVAKPGRHADGNGLYLAVKPTGAKSWSFLYMRDGRRREMGLGGYPDVSLAMARRMAAKHREALALGRDPLTERETPRIPTFGEAADEYIATHSEAWRNEKHVAQWQMTLTHYAAPLRSLPVDRVAVPDVVAVLKPLWSSRPETASRLRGRIEAVLDAAKAEGFRHGENPAAWRGNLKHLLPRPAKLSRGHHSAMHYREVPGFVAKLRKRRAAAALALEFIILTAARAGEVLGAVWGEVDMDEAVWTVPAIRMKSGRTHRVPLSRRALEILNAMHAVRSSDAVDELIFPGSRKGRPLSGMATAMLMRRMGHGEITTHGFRSSFRDWAGEITDFPREIVEAALAHAVGDATERAYRRGDALEKRRQLMEAWASYVGSASVQASLPIDAINLTMSS